MFDRVRPALVAPPPILEHVFDYAVVCPDTSSPKSLLCKEICHQPRRGDAAWPPPVRRHERAGGTTSRRFLRRRRPARVLTVVGVLKATAPARASEVTIWLSRQRAGGARRRTAPGRIGPVRTARSRCPPSSPGCSPTPATTSRSRAPAERSGRRSVSAAMTTPAAPAQPHRRGPPALAGARRRYPLKQHQRAWALERPRPDHVDVRPAGRRNAYFNVVKLGRSSRATTSTSTARWTTSAALRDASFLASGVRAAAACRTAPRCFSGSRLAMAFRYPASRLASGLLAANAFRTASRCASRCASGRRLEGARPPRLRAPGSGRLQPGLPVALGTLGAAAPFKAASLRPSGPLVAAPLRAASLRVSGLLAAAALRWLSRSASAGPRPRPSTFPPHRLRLPCASAAAISRSNHPRRASASARLQPVGPRLGLRKLASRVLDTSGHRLERPFRLRPAPSPRPAPPARSSARPRACPPLSGRRLAPVRPPAGRRLARVRTVAGQWLDLGWPPAGQ